MSFAGSSPLWREFEARFAPVPIREVIHIPPIQAQPEIRDKREICDRFCAKRINFLEIKLRRVREHKAAEAPCEPQPPRLTAREILRHVAVQHGVRVDDILSFSRARRLVRARQEACYEVARLTLHSLSQIGKMLGGRDHSTVWHGIRAEISRGAPEIRGLVAYGKPTPPKPPKARNRKSAGRPPKWPGERMSMLNRLLAQGMTETQAGLIMGCNRNTIQAARRRERARLAAAAKPTPAD